MTGHLVSRAVNLSITLTKGFLIKKLSNLSNEFRMVHTFNLFPDFPNSLPEALGKFVPRLGGRGRSTTKVVFFDYISSLYSPEKVIKINFISNSPLLKLYLAFKTTLTFTMNYTKKTIKHFETFPNNFIVFIKISNTASKSDVILTRQK